MSKPTYITTAAEAYDDGYENALHCSYSPEYEWPTRADHAKPDRFVRAWQDGYRAGVDARCNHLHSYCN
jgi:hypothetical protein